MRLKTYQHRHLFYTENLRFKQGRLSALGRYKSNATWPYLSLFIAYES